MYTYIYRVNTFYIKIYFMNSLNINLDIVIYFSATTMFLLKHILSKYLKLLFSNGYKVMKHYFCRRQTLILYMLSSKGNRACVT